MGGGWSGGTGVASARGACACDMSTNCMVGGSSPHMGWAAAEMGEQHRSDAASSASLAPVLAAITPCPLPCMVPPPWHTCVPPCKAITRSLLAHLPLLKPVLAVHRAQRLLAGGNQVLVLALAWGEGGAATHVLPWSAPDGAPWLKTLRAGSAAQQAAAGWMGMDGNAC